MKISEAIKEIIKLKGLTIFNDYKRFKEFLADFSTDTHKRELDVFKNAVDENMLKMCIDDSLEERRKILKLQIQLENKGLSQDWINFIIESFALSLGWNYIPKPTTQPQIQQVQKQNISSSQNEWTCSCGTVNTTKYCGNCGLPKPAPKSLDWTCVCGTVNTTKFCGNCGLPKGQQQVTTRNAPKQVQQQGNPFKSAKVGDYIKFGNYPQTSNGGVQPIEWQVLSIENGKMLVISRYGLDAKRFDSSSNVWKNSEIRKWLNGDFYNKAFTDQEKKSINLSNLSDVGTTDNVFLLSGDWNGNGEANEYFADDEARKCKATEYAVENGAYVDDDTGCSWWWLRSPFPNYGYSVYDVSYGGDIDCRYVNRDISLARPALSINL